MLEEKLESASERQLMYGEGTRYNFPQPIPKKKRNWKKAIGIGLATAGILGMAYSVRAHEEPDFSKLPNVRQVQRMERAYEAGVQVDEIQFITGTAFKIGEDENKSYYATAYHLKRVPVPPARSKITKQELEVREEFLLDGVHADIEKYDDENDTMIMSIAGHTDDRIVPQCEKPAKIGDQTYIYGYHRGYLGLSEGRIGGLEINVMNHKDYYVDADVLGGASGAPHLKYENNEFCTFGMVLANVDGGFFSVSRPLDYTNNLYQSVLNDSNKK